MFKRFLLIFALVTLVAPAFAAEWMSDWEAAKAKALTEHKLILVLYTGSDWCQPGIKLRAEVLDKPEFEAYAKDKFVLMEVDAPHDATKLTPEQREQNRQLRTQYRVDSCPSMIVLTGNGGVVGGFGGYRNWEDVQVALAKALKAHQDLEAAQKLPDEEKADAEDAVYAAMDPVALAAGGYSTLSQRKAKQQYLEFDSKLSACTAADEWLKTLDECLAVSLPQNRRYLLELKFSIIMKNAESVEDIKAAERVGREIIELLPPQEAAEVSRQMDSDFADPAAILEHLKLRRQQQLEQIRQMELQRQQSQTP